jgi:hypothetical protein
MKIQTNAGEVELTPDMVRPGMVFQAPGREPYTLHRQIVEFGDWVGSDGMAEKTEYLLDAEVRTFLGCDPAIAAREDVERYGVAPGIDAGAHGFARLRGGGAVDLRREAPAASVYTLIDGHGPRYTTGASVSFTEKMRFVGIDATYARAEDVERLCCGAEHAYRVGERAMGRDVCTLAIGDHDTHEDLAMGTRWPARAAWPAVDELPVITGEALDGLAAAWGVERRPAEPDDELRARAGRQVRGMMQAAAKACPGCGAGEAMLHDATCEVLRAKVEDGGASIPPAGTLTIGEGLAAFTFACSSVVMAAGPRRAATVEIDITPATSRAAVDALYGWFASRTRCAIRWHGDEFRMLSKCVSRRTLPNGLVERLTVDLQEAETVPSNPPGMMPDPPGGWRSPEQIDREVSERGRRNREAPLVALVAAVPEGLDPVGWRAAVLAAAERYPETSGRGSAQWVRTVSALLRSGDHVPPGSLTSVVLAVVAYRRALAPQDPRPVPERKTGGRDVRLTVDDGRDD